MKNFVISLEHNNETRRKHIKEQFTKRELDFEFFNAITPNQIEELSRKFNIKIHNHSLTKGELACFFSHISLWQDLIKHNLDYISIFEDDIYLSVNAKDILDNNELKNIHFDILKLEKALEYISISKTGQSKIGNESKVVKIKSEHLGSAGYIITRKGAAKLLSNLQEHGILFPVDILIFNKLLSDENYTIAQVTPAVCIQDFILNPSTNTFPSSLESERAKNHVNKDVKKSKFILIRIFKEAIRPFRRLHSKISLTFKHHLKFMI